MDFSTYYLSNDDLDLLKEQPVETAFKTLLQAYLELRDRETYLGKGDPHSDYLHYRVHYLGWLRDQGHSVAGIVAHMRMDEMQVRLLLMTYDSQKRKEETPVPEASRWWVSWYEKTEVEPRAENPKAVVAIWETGCTEADELTMCAIVDAPSEGAAQALIRAYRAVTHFRFCVPKPKNWMPKSDRFPLPSEPRDCEPRDAELLYKTSAGMVVCGKHADEANLEGEEAVEIPEGAHYTYEDGCVMCRTTPSEGRTCANEDCGAPLHPNWPSLYCDNDCAYADA